mmetsp:Transcript_3/g.5  ORF Transcript_3/g.5 Transcript_3/m.5 type:complete len:331 (+) Transcript_3:59-1051(+)
MSSEDEDLTTLSLKALKDLIARAGLSSADCIDKADLRTRAAEAQERLKASAPKTRMPPGGGGGNNGSFERASRKFGPYDCIVLGHSDVMRGSATADLCVVILHGLGATSSDFADLPSMLGVDAALAGRRMVYVFPQAPAVPMLGYAWWQIDVMSFLSLQSAAPDAIAKLIREPPSGLDRCRASLAALLQEVRGFAAAASRTPLHPKRLLLGGFSQGAMTSMDAALQMAVDGPVGGVAFLSGAPIVVEQWAAKLQVLKRGGASPLPVLVTHGVADATLPYACSGWVKELLDSNGADVTFVSHGGGHELGGPQVVKALIDFVARVANAAAEV